MLISPPFLPSRDSHTTEDAWINLAMDGGEVGNGAFPVSYKFEWHGGMHLTAPKDPKGAALSVCAIADGTVVYTREKTDAPSLTFGKGYTSDGVVVIRHDMEIGVNAEGVASKITFYSVYKHLNSISKKVKLGAINRKMVLGEAGYIAGTPNLIHFEICCDEANLKSLIGRVSGEVDRSVNGRTDVVFGEVYFYLPQGTEIFGAEPFSRYPRPVSPPAPLVKGAKALTEEQKQARQNIDVLEPISVAYTSEADLVVGLKFTGGSVTQTTYHLDGTEIGAPSTPEPNAEYLLYVQAEAICNNFPIATRPQASVVYDLLRFGRVLGADGLTPEDLPYWRKVKYPGGEGWVNLNAAMVRKFSDADFPHWKSWKLIDDDGDTNSRCDSAMLKSLIYPSEEAAQQHSEARAMIRLSDEIVRKKMARTICKFPSEWDASTIDSRWSWLQLPGDENPNPLTPEEFSALKNHLQALCISLPELFTAQWCFNPKEFIKHFRQFCIWPDLINRWSTARTDHVLPVDDDLGLFAKTSLYEYAMRSSRAATRNHRDVEDFAALQALDRGNAAIFGMRVHTDINAETGKGAWDDRVTIIRKDETGLVELRYRGRYTTEPSGHYLDGGYRMKPTKNNPNGEGKNVGGSSHKDIGRLIADRTYEYYPFNRDGYGELTFGNEAHPKLFNILKKTVSSQVERLVFNGTVLANGQKIDESNSSWKTGSEAGYAESQSIHFHHGYRGNTTGSAGCQTFPGGKEHPAESIDKFLKQLEPATSASRFQYTLFKM